MAEPNVKETSVFEVVPDIRGDYIVKMKCPSCDKLVTTETEFVEGLFRADCANCGCVCLCQFKLRIEWE